MLDHRYWLLRWVPLIPPSRQSGFQNRWACKAQLPVSAFPIHGDKLRTFRVIGRGYCHFLIHHQQLTECKAAVHAGCVDWEDIPVIAHHIKISLILQYPVHLRYPSAKRYVFRAKSAVGEYLPAFIIELPVLHSPSRQLKRRVSKDHIHAAVFHIPRNV